jgi:Peptidase_C39 like family
LTTGFGSGASNVADVPYFSQWESADLVPAFLSGELPARADPLWAQSEAESPAEYEFWSWRACGVACLRMMLSWWNGDAPASLPLVRECVDSGSYVVKGDDVKGLIYAPFSEYVHERWGLDASVHPELGLRSVAQLVNAETLAIISVHPSVRDPRQSPPRAGGHLVLVVGSGPEGLVLHNPSGLPNASQRFVHVPLERLTPFYAGRGIVVRHS